jgi:hypothetical protein
MSMQPSGFSPIDQVREAIEELAARLDCTVTPGAMNSLLAPGAAYFRANPSVIPLSPVRLNDQLTALFDAVATVRGPLRGQTLDESDFATARVTLACHYLWFC